MKRFLLSALFSVTMIVTAFAQIPEDGLAGRYELDNTSLEDSGPNGYDLEIVGVGGVLLPVENRFGETNRALKLVNEYLNMDSNPNVFDFDDTDALSIAAWVIIDQTIIDWTAVFNNWAGFGIGGYYLGITPDQQIRWNINADPPIDSNPVSTGEWMHIAATYDGNTAILYLDGIAVGQNVYGAPILPSSFSFTVGAQADLPTNVFPGSLDEILLYDRALTGQEVLDIYENVPLSISEFDRLSHKVQVAPNPVNAQFNMSVDAALGNLVSYRITDMKGSVILEAAILDMNKAIDVNSLAAGAYLLTFQSEFGTEITKRLLKN